ncbi:MAG: hypothetical protein N2037_05985 [Acidimicrobiales bacterium]|nr:hypothetical protein [Acidimicrobiales bacterium]
MNTGQPPQRLRTRTMPTVGVVLGVFVLVSVLVTTFVAATTNDGASSPEGAVRAIFDAISQRNLIGVVEALPPGERRAIAASLPALVEQLRRIGFVDDVPLDDIGGSVAVEGLTLTRREFSGEVVRVDVTGGMFRVAWSQSSEPISPMGRRVLADLGLDVFAPGEEFVANFADDPLHLMTIKEGGGWHVSLSYTIAESLRRRVGAPEPWWGRGPAAIGADTAEDSVRDLFGAAAKPDPGRAQSIAYPEELPAFYDYAPLFLADMRRVALETYQEGQFSFAFSELVLESDRGGHERTIRVKRFDGTFGDSVERIRVRYDAGCATFELRRVTGQLDARGNAVDQVQVERRCDGDISPLSDRVRGSKWYRLISWTQLGKLFPTFVVRERDGRWFVSPIRTALVSLTEALGQLPPDAGPDFADRLAEVSRAYRSEDAAP